MNEIQNDNSFNKFPRRLTERERDFLFSILPENKKGYNLYRDKIDSSLVIGFGRFGDTNLVLGKENSPVDLDLPSAPIFASGVVVCKEGNVDILIHEEIDDEIEFDISFQYADKVPENLNEVKRWSYSEWIPGNKAPGDNSEIREIIIEPQKKILAIAPVHKKIWLHNYKDEVNYLLPVTNYYNYLMIIKNIRDPKIILKNKLLFKELDSYSDEELMLAFISYNKYFRRFNIDYNPIKSSNQKRTQKFKFFKRDKN